MPGIFIIAHAPLASALKSVAEHAFPDATLTLQAFDVLPDVPVEDIEAQARDLLQRVCNPNALILTDVVGATPCNVAQRLAESAVVRVVAGVNVPMLWRTLCYRNEPLEALAARAVAGATQGVVQVSAQTQNQTADVGAHDHGQCHHHQ